MDSNPEDSNMNEDPDIDMDDELEVTEDEAETPTPTSASKGKGKKKVTAKGKKRTRSFVWDHYTRTKANYDKSKNSNQEQLDPDGMKLCRVSDAVVREATNEMIVIGELPLSFVECLAWRHFCNIVKLCKPVSRRTSTRDIYEMLVRKKTLMKKVLGDRKQRLSLTTDIWTAPTTNSSYMVITAHFIDRDWQLKHLIIGFKHVCDHKGKKIYAALIDCLADWEIKKVFCITVDNATANSSAIGRFKQQFTQVGADSLVLGGEYLHVRCSTHIINLIVRDGLHDLDKHVCAIRNGVGFVRSSTPRQMSFELRVDTAKMTRGSLSLDCKTRWNSTYLMLSRAMDFRLAFEKMVAEDKLYNDYFKERVDGTKRIGPPVQEDWDEIDRFLNFLIIFYNATLVLSATNSPRAHKCYNEILTIERNLVLLTLDPDTELKEKADDMMSKLGKYWNPFGFETEMNRMLIVASVFDPRNKMKFAKLCFEKLYGPDSMVANEMYDSVMEILKMLFEEYNGKIGSSLNRTSNASTSATSDPTQASGSSSQPRSQELGRSRNRRMELAGRTRYERMDLVYMELVQETGFQEVSTELELYLSENVENPHIFEGTEYDVLSWWKSNG
ncbi:zinc finger BED domain-containing protein RICESLEEPER 2-like [Eutrema salsugineum]|uniref:zinc finger BED domain-containing protein RICESLEEPER 2-like n=1 Tax=Eutrema salsugineum TaxID=72664 RepID=UPI000CED2162|nr:zinc finger BED domain-containing protein RICESLEEPER 2-like [Eutrema salsugineum]